MAVNTDSKEIFRATSLEKNRDKCDKFQLTQTFNHAVSIVVAGMYEIPAEITEPINCPEVYHVINLPVHALITPEFIGAFIKSGNFNLICHGCDMEYCDCVALTNSGKLVLNVTKATYQKLGLEGRAADGRRKDPLRYIIDLDIMTLATSQKQYTHTFECLQNCPELCMDFLFTWTPHDPKICSSSVQTYLTSKGHNCLRIQPEISHTTSKQLCPLVDGDRYTETACGDTSCDYEQVFDWLGAVSCGVNVSNETSGGYLSSFGPPSPSVADDCVVYTSCGLIPSRHIQTVFHNLCKLSKDQQKTAYMTVHSFRDNPLFTSLHEPITSLTQTSYYTYVIFPSGKLWFLKSFERT